MLKIYLVQTAGVLLVLAALRQSGAHPASLFMAFLFSYFYRLLTLRTALLAAGGGAVPAWVSFVTRSPCAADSNAPIRQGDHAGPPAPFWVYIMILLVMAYLGFILTHSASSSRLDITWALGWRELLSAAGLAAIWWAQDLGNGAIVADLRRDLAHNLGFNSQEAVIAAVTVLTAGALIVAGETLGFKRGPWMTIAPLLFYKWVWGVWLDKRHLMADGGKP